MAHTQDIKEIESIILSDPKALYFATELFASISFKSCKIESVPLGFKVTKITLYLGNYILHFFVFLCAEKCAHL